MDVNATQDTWLDVNYKRLAEVQVLLFLHNI